MSVIPDSLTAELAPEFELLRPLGTGQLGVVYLARETALQRLVAVKLPRPELAADPLVRRRFEREGRAAARLTHPNIAAIHRVGCLDDGTPYLVMSYYEGQTLADALDAVGPLAQDTAIDVLTQLASALAAAHAQHVIHRDVRPGNVIWQPEAGRAVLTDFGLAGILETGSEAVTRLTDPGEVIGDPGYASPEQLLGEPVTPTTDVYGLGILGYEVLTREKPYRATSPGESAAAHLHQAPRNLAELLPGVDPRLATLLEHCLAKRPERRPRAGELESRLRAIVADPGTAAAPGLAGAPARAHAQGGGGPVADLGRRTVDAAVDGLPTLQAFLIELAKRRVYGVAVVYMAAAFFILQAVQLIEPGLPLPSWFYPGLVIITLVGFPIALVLAWMFDVTATGVHRVAPDPGASSRLGLRLLQIAALGLSFALAALAGWWFLQARR